MTTVYIYPMINHSCQVDRSLCETMKEIAEKNYFFEIKIDLELIQLAFDSELELIQFAEFFLTLCFEIF
jgi:hypothetical protein